VRREIGKLFMIVPTSLNAKSKGCNPFLVIRDCESSQGESAGISERCS
jgi:hypothetical protein